MNPSPAKSISGSASHSGSCAAPDQSSSWVTIVPQVALGSLPHTRAIWPCIEHAEPANTGRSNIQRSTAAGARQARQELGRIPLTLRSVS